MPRKGEPSYLAQCPLQHSAELMKVTAATKNAHELTPVTFLYPEHASLKGL